MKKKTESIVFYIGNNSIESAIGNLDILFAYARRLNNE